MTPEQEKILRVLSASSLPGSFALVDSIRSALMEIDRLRAENADYKIMENLIIENDIQLLKDARLETTRGAG